MLILSSAITACVSISVFGSIVCVPVGIPTSAVGVKICAITVEIQKYKSIKEKKHDKIVVLQKDKFNTFEVLISKALINSYISHDKFVPANNVLREYYKVKKEIKNP